MTDKKIQILKVRRSQVVGDKPVTVHFESAEGERFGTIRLPKPYWLAYQKIVQEGESANARQNYVYPLRVVIEGFVEKEEIPEEVTVKSEPEGSGGRLVRSLGGNDED